MSATGVVTVAAIVTAFDTIESCFEPASSKRVNAAIMFLE